MKKLVVFAAMLVLAPIESPAARQWGPGSQIRIATEGSYKPWNFRQRDGTLAGFEVDLVNMLCADLAFQCSFQAEQWSRILPNLARGKFDAVFAGMSITLPRKTKAIFTQAYATTPAVFVAATGGRLPETTVRHISLPKLNAAEQDGLVALRRAFLNGQVGVQKGTTHEIFLREYIEGYAGIKTYKNQQALDRDVKGRKVSAMLVSLGYAIPFLKSRGNRTLKIVGPRLSGGPFGEGIAAAVRLGDRELADAFSTAIRKRLADGSIQRLSEKWFGFDLSAAP